MSCPSWCRYTDDHHACMSDPLWSGNTFAALLMLSDWDGNAYSPRPYVQVAAGDAAKAWVTATVANADRLASLLESLGHKELADAVRQLIDLAAGS